MDDLAILYYREKGPCHNYKVDDAIDFKYGDGSDVPEILNNRKKAKICWGFLLAGKLEIRGERDRIELEEGEMFLLPALPYTFSLLSERTQLILFTCDRPAPSCLSMVNELAGQRVEWEQQIVKVAIQEPLNKFLNLLLTYLRSGINCSSLFEVKQKELFMLLKALYPGDILGKLFYTLTLYQDNDLRKLVEENYMRAKSVQELAQICGYSVNGFKRAFKEVYHVSVYRWMLQQKAGLLREKLSEEGVNLKTVIDELGFSSPAHFTKFCKQWLGMVPTKFIEKTKKEREHLLIDRDE